MDERATDRARRLRRASWACTGAAALGLTLVLLADAYLSHGYSATWFTQVDGERVELTRTTEHRVTFPNVHRPLARIIQGWPFERLPMPEQLPEVDVTLRARLTVPPGLGRRLTAQATRDAVIWADGHPLERTQRLEPGPHDLWIHWTAHPQPHGGDSGRSRRSDTASFELRWTPGEPVPASALEPAEGTSRGGVWALGILFSLLFAAWIFSIVSEPRDAARGRRWGQLALVVVVLLSVGLRAFDHDVMPEFRENADELFATWNGWSLIESGTTRGWSLWPQAYGGSIPTEEVRFFGETRTVISPYFEHPPLLHLLVGVAAHLGGADHWMHAKLTHTRWVPILLAGLCVFFVVQITRRITPRGPAPYLAGLLYAMLPSIVLQTRVIKEEALLTVLLTGMVYFFQRWRDDGYKDRDLIVASVLAGAGVLTKVPAVVYVPALVMLVAAERGQWRRVLLAGGIGLGIAALLPMYGAIIDWDTFVFTTQRQGGRPVHWNLFPRWFDATMINHNPVGRGWILFLWLGFVSAVSRRGWRSTAPLTVPLVAYMCAIAIGAGNWTFGWYIVPFYPLLCVGAGLSLARLWDKPDLLSGTLFIVLLVMYTMNFTLDVSYAKQPAAWGRLRRIVTVFVAATVAPYAAAQVWREHRAARQAARVVTALGLCAVLAVSTYFVVRYDVLYESHHAFDGDEYFTR